QSIAQMDLAQDVLFDSYRAAGRVVNSIERRVRAVTASRDLAAKLSVDEGAGLLEIARLVRDVSGAILDRQVRLYRGDRFSLALDAPNADRNSDIPFHPRLHYDG